MEVVAMAKLVEIRETDVGPIALYEPEDRPVPSWQQCRGWKAVELRLRTTYQKSLQIHDAPAPRDFELELQTVASASVTLSRRWDPRNLDRKAWTITVEAWDRVDNPAVEDAIVQVTYRDVRIAYGDALAQARKIIQGHRNAVQKRHKAAQEARKATSQGELFAGLEGW
jgi:hypothetical protein